MQTGDLVIIKDGVKDSDLDIIIGGFTYRIVEIIDDIVRCSAESYSPEYEGACLKAGYDPEAEVDFTVDDLEMLQEKQEELKQETGLSDTQIDKLLRALNDRCLMAGTDMRLWLRDHRADLVKEIHNWWGDTFPVVVSQLKGTERG